MPISKIKTSSITADAASINLNIDANTLFLDVANNRVGVGTTSPSSQLSVYGIGGDAVFLSSAVTTTGAADTGNGITFGGSDGSNHGRLFGRVGVYKENSTVGDVSSYMSFGTRLHPAGTVEKMRLDSVGNFLIGITDTNPPASANAFAFSKSDNTLRFSNTTANGKVWTIGTSTPGIASQGDFFSFGRYSGASWAESARFTTAGLGVGITSPSAIIHTQSSGLGDTGGIKLGNSGAGGTTFAIWPTATVNGEGAGKLIFSSGSNLMTLDSSGKLGIGTTNPTYKLDLHTNNATNSVRLMNNGMGGLGNGPQIDFSITQTNSQSARLAAIGTEFISNWGGALVFYTKTAAGAPDTTVTEKLRINPSGGLEFKVANGVSAMLDNTGVNMVKFGGFTYSNPGYTNTSQWREEQNNGVYTTTFYVYFGPGPADSRSYWYLNIPTGISTWMEILKVDLFEGNWSYGQLVGWKEQLVTAAANVWTVQSILSIDRVNFGGVNMFATPQGTTSVRFGGGNTASGNNIKYVITSNRSWITDGMLMTFSAASPF